MPGLKRLVDAIRRRLISNEVLDSYQSRQLDELRTSIQYAHDRISRVAGELDRKVDNPYL